VKWQFFMSLYGVHLEYPAHRLDDAFSPCIAQETTLHRQQFMRAALPYNKRVLLLVDYGWLTRYLETCAGSASDRSQLQMVKDSVSSVLSVLTDVDDVAMIAVDGVEATTLPSCDNQLTLRASLENKDKILNSAKLWRLSDR